MDRFILEVWIWEQLKVFLKKFLIVQVYAKEILICSFAGVG